MEFFYSSQKPSKLLTQYTAMNTTRMYANSHIQLGNAGNHSNQIDGFDHIKTHLNGTTCMIGSGFR